MEKRKKIAKSIRNVFRSVFRKIFPPAIVFAKVLGLVYSKRSFLRQAGYIQSARYKHPCKADGTPIPWMNYSIIAFLEERLTKDLSLFEYGCGNSTLFYSQHVGEVVSVECDLDWYNHIVDKLPKNVKLILQNPFSSKKYLEVIKAEQKKFDVIIIDAEDRSNCLKIAPDFVSEQGVIILDDTQRIDPDSDKKMQELGFKHFVFRGLKPGAIREYCSTLFYRPDNCLGL